MKMISGPWGELSPADVAKWIVDNNYPTEFMSLHWKNLLLKEFNLMNLEVSDETLLNVKIDSLLRKHFSDKRIYYYYYNFKDYKSGWKDKVADDFIKTLKNQHQIVLPDDYREKIIRMITDYKNMIDDIRSFKN